MIPLFFALAAADRVHKFQDEGDDEDDNDAKGRRRQKKSELQRNALKPVFPGEKELADQYFNKAPVEYDNIFDSVDADFTGKRDSTPPPTKSQHYEDANNDITLVSVTPQRIFGSKNQILYLEIQPGAVSSGFARFEYEEITECERYSDKLMSCKSPKLQPGDVRISFSPDNSSWTNTLSIYVYNEQSNMAKWIIFPIVAGVMFLVIIAIYVFMVGGLETQEKVKKPKALSQKQSSKDNPKNRSMV